MVTAIGGPIRDRQAERLSDKLAKDELWDRAASHHAASDARVQDWLAHIRRTGRLARLDPTSPDATLQSTLDVLTDLFGSSRVATASTGPLSIVAGRRSSLLYGDR